MTPGSRTWGTHWGKRGFDVGVCLLVLPVALPLMALIAGLVRLESPGPVVFRQRRTGQDGRRFEMFKFRTMVANAEELKASLAHLNVLPPPDFKIIDDPRITRVGAVLRRTSLDELPQLFNVLRGDMTLVGPRPTSFAPETYAPWHGKRLELRPGLTGLWQVRARHSTSFDERLRFDIAYVDGCSFRLDLQILVATVLSVVRRTGV